MLPLLFLKAVIDYLAKHAKGTAILVAWLLWLGGVIQQSVSMLVTSFTKLLSIDITAFNGVNFSGIEYIGYVNAIIPLSEFIGLLTIYLTAWSIVIVIRWIKSFIPTLAN